jgi:uncharacterized membrane protein
MPTTAHDLAQQLFQRAFDQLSAQEQRLVQHLAHGKPISRNTNADFDEQLTFGQRIADRVAAFGGSWAFILSFLAILVGWITLNTLILARQGEAFDPYPFILLNLVLSMIAALQAPPGSMLERYRSSTILATEGSKNGLRGVAGV